MAVEIIVPRLGWSMEEGSFVAWLKEDGAEVRAGEPLFSIEGDKAIQEIESIDAGILRIDPNAPKAGDPIRVGQVLGRLESKTAVRSSPQVPKPATSSGTSKAGAPTPVASTTKAEKVIPVDTTASGSTEKSRRRAITPRALRRADQLHVDWSHLSGTGAGGRIRERDIVTAAQSAGNHLDTLASAPKLNAVFFGELLMRLTTQHQERFVQARTFDVRYTGAEANAAVSLAQLGIESHVVSAVPDQEIGQACINYLRQYGVHTDSVLRRGQRLGTLYLELGAPPRPSKVIYDRAGSSFSALKSGDVDWEVVLKGKHWFHWSGTVPAVGAGLAELLAEGCAVAKKCGVKVSCDINYRSTLWSQEQARQTLAPLMSLVDLVIGNVEHVGMILGSEVAPASCNTESIRAVTEIGARFREQFGTREVALTLRGQPGGAEHAWRGLLVNASGAFPSRTYLPAAVDRIGAGDAFSAVLIYARLMQMSDAEAIELATAAGCFKHSVAGDFNLMSATELAQIAQGDSGHRVIR